MQNLNKKVGGLMISIDKTEAIALRQKFGKDICIYRTCKEKSRRHHYYCEESSKVKKLLEEFDQNINIKESNHKSK